MECSPPGSSVHGIFWARVLVWVAISFSRGSSQPRDRTWVSRIVGRGFTIWAIREPHGSKTHRQIGILFLKNTKTFELFFFSHFNYISIFCKPEAPLQIFILRFLAAWTSTQMIGISVIFLFKVLTCRWRCYFQTLLWFYFPPRKIRKSHLVNISLKNSLTGAS